MSTAVVLDVQLGTNRLVLMVDLCTTPSLTAIVM